MKKLSILVIDDSAANIASALQTLHGHEVTVCDNVDVAFKILCSAMKFVAVLTDLFMPIGKFDYGREVMFPSIKKPKKGIPVGLIFALRAVNLEIRTVICTDSDHHSDWHCNLLDMLCFPGDVKRRAAFVEARTANLLAYWEKSQLIVCSSRDEWRAKYSERPLIKDWLKVMKRSEIFPEVVEA